MITATLQEAKAKLNKLVELAQAGQEVVLFRGSRVVARILPLSEKDLELAARLSDAQADRFWKEIRKERGKGFPGPQAAVRHLKKRYFS